jgi:hypothetical protein
MCKHECAECIRWKRSVKKYNKKHKGAMTQNIFGICKCNTTGYAYARWDDIYCTRFFKSIILSIRQFVYKYLHIKLWR